MDPRSTQFYNPVWFSQWNWKNEKKSAFFDENQLWRYFAPSTTSAPTSTRGNVLVTDSALRVTWPTGHSCLIMTYGCPASDISQRSGHPLVTLTSVLGRVEKLGTTYVGVGRRRVVGQQYGHHTIHTHTALRWLCDSIERRSYYTQYGGCKV